MAIGAFAHTGPLIINRPARAAPMQKVDWRFMYANAQTAPEAMRILLLLTQSESSQRALSGS
jgi:hypothetical protein